MATNWLKSRQTKYGAYAGVYIVVILAVLAAINFLANRYDKSYDSTANKQFSLVRPDHQSRRRSSSTTSRSLLRRDDALSAGARPAGSLRRAFAEAARGIHRPGEEAAAGAGRRLPPRRQHPGRQRHAEGRGQER